MRFKVELLCRREPGTKTTGRKHTGVKILSNTVLRNYSLKGSHNLMGLAEEQYLSQGMSENNSTIKGLQGNLVARYGQKKES